MERVDKIYRHLECFTLVCCRTMFAAEVFTLTAYLVDSRYNPHQMNFKAYGKRPKNLNTKASDKMTCANSVDPD